MTKKFKRFCINCGRSGLSKEELLDGLCFKCYKLKKFLIKLKKEPILTICKDCFAIKLKNEWIKTNEINFYEQADGILNSNINTFFEISPNTIVTLRFVEFPDFRDLFKYNTIRIIADVKSQVHQNLELNKTVDFTAKLKLGICDTCKDIKANVYRSKIRIIAKKRKITDNEIEKIINIFKNNAEIYKDPNLYILPPILSSSELIFKVSSIDFAKNVANQLKNKFGAVLRESVKFVDREKNKTKKQDLIILVRLLPFFSGDIIKFENKLYYIINIQSDFVNCFDFKSREVKKFKTKQIIKSEKYFDSSKLEKNIINAIKKDVIQIMNLK
ncbi:MAG: NMD3-related protein, partial [Candidatus Helarchaeota archaeon]